MKNLYLFLIGIAFVLFFITTRSFNVLVVKSQNVKAKWEQLEGPVSRRNDLIRDVLNVIRGSAMSEEMAFNELDVLRSKALNLSTIDEKIAVTSEVDIALSRLLKSMENYPELQSKEAYSKVMNELPGVINRIEIEKSKYNAAVREYNEKIRNLPSSIIANLFGYKLALEYP